jgi:exodeoxyribonuclease-3
MKLVTWNVNGLRSVQKKGFLDWLKTEDADVVCLQEVKISASQVDEDETLSGPFGYHSHWSFAEKPGYSGVGIYSRDEPTRVVSGLGIADFDREGRWLEADFTRAGAASVTVVSTYWPNSQRDRSRLGFKLEFCRAAEARLEQLRREARTVLVCGDFNIAHREIDLRNPKSNQDNAGFLPEERAWMDHFVTELGWLDTFREFEAGPGHYTWWSYRPGVREKNIGWRLDYFFINPEARSRLQSAEILASVNGSDHCPMRITLST